MSNGEVSGAFAGAETTAEAEDGAAAAVPANVCPDAGATEGGGGGGPSSADLII